MARMDIGFRPVRTDELDPAEPGPMEKARPLFVLARVLEERYPDLALHGNTVAGYCAITARELGFDDPAIERIALAGELHDVGKVAVDDRILRKAGPLDPEEWRQIQRHPEVGSELLLSANLDDAARWVLAHHERPDGLGYPYGLAGHEIPMPARILAVADAYDAMRTDRVYRPAVSHGAAATELRIGRGTQFDAGVVDAFLAALRRRSRSRRAQLRMRAAAVTLPARG